MEVEEQIELIDVRLVADGDELREAEIPLFLRQKVEDGFVKSAPQYGARG